MSAARPACGWVRGTRCEFRTPLDAGCEYMRGYYAALGTHAFEHFANAYLDGKLDADAILAGPVLYRVGACARGAP